MAFQINSDQFQRMLKSIENTTQNPNFYTDIFQDTAKEIDRHSQKGIARVTNELSESFKTDVVSRTELEFGYDVPYSAYNNNGIRADGSRQIRNRTPPGRKGWFTDTLKEEKWIKSISDNFFNNINSNL